ncbi:troponin I isoform X3 [Bacillus rossius redtenbacheri]|uniref:troponin I isoform X3 n=1 Tax=Bacillus rossius redtenbacheri TaxID=93214 RepID=UPI002FDEBE74
MADDERRRIEEAKKAKQAEIDRKRAEVRKRLEEASKAKKAKKGFMTPERKKKLRLLLRKKAAEELKKEQERKAAERRRIIEERCGKPKNIEDANEANLKSTINAYYKRINALEEEKYDHEVEVARKDLEISELNSQVNELRGKFMKPTLKKVSKYENKFAKLQKKAAEFNFRNQLKVVKKKEFTLEEEDKEVGFLAAAECLYARLPVAGLVVTWVPWALGTRRPESTLSLSLSANESNKTSLLVSGLQ